MNKFYGDNTNIIDYRQTWSQFQSDSKQYQQYFNAKLNLLQIDAQQKLDTYKEAKKICGIFNGTNFEIDESKIAESAVSQLQNFNTDEVISNLYSSIINIADDLGDNGDKYTESLGNLLQIKNGLMSGQSFTIMGKDIPEFSKIIKEGMYQKGRISNLIGNLGQHTSALAGAAIANSLVEELAKQLNLDSSLLKISAIYEDTGDVRKGKYRYQTDNKLSIKILIDQGAELNFSFNISDKANKELAKLKNKKTTGLLKFRDSTVAATTKDLNPKEKYNTISYHWIIDNDNRMSGMWFPAGEALRSYVGYKMLIDMFIKSSQNLDEIDFTVYGSKIIPENNVATKLLSQKESGRFRYAADISYYQLLKDSNSAVKSELEAIQVIDRMRTTIRASLMI